MKQSRSVRSGLRLAPASGSGARQQAARRAACSGARHPEPSSLRCLLSWRADRDRDPRWPPGARTRGCRRHDQDCSVWCLPYGGSVLDLAFQMRACPSARAVPGSGHAGFGAGRACTGADQPRRYSWVPALYASVSHVTNSASTSPRRRWTGIFPVTPATPSGWHLPPAAGVPSRGRLPGSGQGARAARARPRRSSSLMPTASPGRSRRVPLLVTSSGCREVKPPSRSFCQP